MATRVINSKRGTSVKKENVVVKTKPLSTSDKTDKVGLKATKKKDKM